MYPEQQAPTSHRPVSVDIDLTAIAANARAVKRLIGQSCALMAVVKANAYGLGAPWVAQAALEGGATWLGVGCVDEGVQLRRAGFDCPVLVMAYSAPEEAPAVVEYGLTVVLHRESVATELENAAQVAGLGADSVPVHIKVDTGVGRFGCLPEEFLPLARFVQGCPQLRLEGLMTHFAEADSPDLTFAREQLAHFQQVRRKAQDHGIEFQVIHASNSAATLSLPEARLDMVRVGIMLSGNYPAEHLHDRLQLQSTVTWRTRLARVYQLEARESVGYGRTWVASRPSTIGLLPVGYADGYMRSLSNRSFALVGGQRCPIVGRISMDQTTVDLTDLPQVSEGDEVVLIGRQGGEEITADEVAHWAGTISWEVLSDLAPRVPRRYFRQGRQVGECDLHGCSPLR